MDIVGRAMTSRNSNRVIRLRGLLLVSYGGAGPEWPHGSGTTLDDLASDGRPEHPEEGERS